MRTGDEIRARQAYGVAQLEQLSASIREGMREAHELACRITLEFFVREPTRYGGGG